MDLTSQQIEKLVLNTVKRLYFVSSNIHIFLSNARVRGRSLNARVRGMSLNARVRGMSCNNK